MQCRATPVSLLLLALLFSPLAGAAVYKWTDAEGTVHYSEEKPDEQAVTEMTIQQTPALPHLIEGPDGKLVEVPASSAPLAERCQGHDSFVLTGTTYCCTAACVSDKRAKNLNFSCATQQCYEALIAPAAQPTDTTTNEQPQGNGQADTNAE